MVLVDQLRIQIEREPLTIRKFIDVIICWLGETSSVDTLAQAKERYFEQYGKVFVEDTFFDHRMSYFTSVLLFEHKLNFPETGATTPFHAFVRWFNQNLRHVVKLGTRLEEMMEAMSFNKHSLFELAKENQQGWLVHDLISKTKRYQLVPELHQKYRGVDRKDIFQGFIFPGNDGRNYLGPSVLVHPNSVRRQIKKELRQAAHDAFWSKTEYLSRLARLQLKHLRMQHVDAGRIYQV